MCQFPSSNARRRTGESSSLTRTSSTRSGGRTRNRTTRSSGGIRRPRRRTGSPSIAVHSTSNRNANLGRAYQMQSTSSRPAAAGLEEVDCIWYARPRFAFLFEVEWTAMLGEPVLRRGRRIPPDDRVVRFLVLPPERVELVRVRLDDSPVLRRAFDEGNWHILRSDALKRFAELAEAALDKLEPY